jgi:hypothetical protein
VPAGCGKPRKAIWPRRQRRTPQRAIALAIEHAGLRLQLVCADVNALQGADPTHAPLAAPRGSQLKVRSHCRCRKRGTEYVSKSGIKWTSGRTKQQCDRDLSQLRSHFGLAQQRDRAEAQRPRARQRPLITGSFQPAWARPTGRLGHDIADVADLAAERGAGGLLRRGTAGR